MAKIVSPSGETEFFQITELQSAFEKELKTGERATVIAGAKEASFLREAPTRAEWVIAFQQFKERVLNPVNPIQPPVNRFVCTAVGRPMTLSMPDAYASNAVAYNQTPVLRFSTAIDTTAGSYAVPQCNQKFVGSPDGGGNYVFFPPAFQSAVNKSNPSAVEIVVPDYYTLTASIEYWETDDPPNSEIIFDPITMTNGLGGGTNFSTGAFSCLGVPNSPSLPIFEIKADLYVPKYGGPFNYGVTTNCSYTLFNYRFTNFYP